MGARCPPIFILSSSTTAQRLCEVWRCGERSGDYYGNVLQVYQTATGKEETHRFDNFERNQMFIDELKHFLACIRGEESPLIDLREGQRSMLIAQAASESLNTGTAIRVTHG
jgi:predicted dehydrogenase